MNAELAAEADTISHAPNVPIGTQDSNTRKRNPPTTHAQNSIPQIDPTTGAKWFRSRRVKRGTLERPWKNLKDPREKWVNAIPIIGICIGLLAGGAIIWDG